MRNAFKRRKYARFATACLGALISTGCANFGKPNDLTRINEASYTVYLKEQSRLSFDPVDPAWWRSFDDPVLDRLIEVTANQNIDLAIARSRLEQARSNRRSEIARFGPRINFGGSASAQRQSETSVLPVGDVPGFDADNVVYEAGFDADWELDIFGRNKLDRSSANERLRLAEIDRDAVLVAVLSEVAREYLEFRLAQQEAEKLRQIIEARTAILTMVERRQAVGEASEHEAHLERAALADARARLPDAILRIRTSLVRLDLLTGNQPGKIVQEMTEAAPLPAIPDAAPVGLVSDLLRRREDVRSAEANYAIAENDRALADLEFLPRFSLFGSAGVETVDLADFFDQDSVVASLAGLFSWTLFDGGERDAVRDAARAKSEQAALAYRDAVISALAEVESDAARFVEIAREADMRREERTTRERIVSNEKRKFEVGTTNRVEVKRAQISFYESELRFTRAHAQALINLVALQKSLGGALGDKNADAVALDVKPGIGIDHAPSRRFFASQPKSAFSTNQWLSVLATPLIGLIATSVEAQDKTATVTVEAISVPAETSGIHIYLWRQEGVPVCSPGATFYMAAQKSGDLWRAFFHNTPTGAYAIGGYTDINGDGEIERDFIGP